MCEGRKGGRETDEEKQGRTIITEEGQGRKEGSKHMFFFFFLSLLSVV